MENTFGEEVEPDPGIPSKCFALTLSNLLRGATLAAHRANDAEAARRKRGRSEDKDENEDKGLDTLCGFCMSAQHISLLSMCVTGFFLCLSESDYDKIEPHCKACCDRSNCASHHWVLKLSAL